MKKYKIVNFPCPEWNLLYESVCKNGIAILIPAMAAIAICALRTESSTLAVETESCCQRIFYLNYTQNCFYDHTKINNFILLEMSLLLSLW